MYMLNTGRSSNKPCVRWLREICLLCFVYNLDVFASYARSENNVLADSLSHFDDLSKLKLTVELLCHNARCCTDLLFRADRRGAPSESGVARIKCHSSFNCQKRGYFRFFEEYSYDPFELLPTQVVMHIAYLSSTLVFSTISHYVSGL